MIRSVGRTAVGVFAAAVASVAAFAGSAAAAPLGGSARYVAGTTTVSFTAAAAAPVMQITEDAPTAQFHPQGEGDYGYTLVTADNDAANALAAVAWPGAAAGNAGTLVALLGGPDESALNDPAQASAATGGTATHSTLGTSPGPVMTASVVPTGTDDEHTTASSVTSGGGLGSAGSVGSSESTSTIDFDQDTGTVDVTASSSASDIDVGGVVDIGSVTSSASATSTGAATPTLQGDTVVHHMTVAGQSAYLDGTGVHLGSPGAPAGPAEVAAVDSALKQAGMEIYFTSPHTITVGGTAYYYAASVLFYWAPPGDPSHDSLTMTVGGSGVSMTASGTPSTTYVAPPPAGGPAAVPPSSAASPPSAAVGTVGADGGAAPVLASTGGSGTSLSLPASPAAAASATPADTGAGQGDARPAGFDLPGGIGAGWIVLLLAVGLLGAALTTRLPGLLERRAAAVCPRQKSSHLSERLRP